MAGVVVVAAAIVRADPSRVLAACRSYPTALAGRWELPGGKVEPGESDVEALRRECREELGVDVSIGDRIGPEVPTVGGDGVLRAYLAGTTGEPRPIEHSALRWLTSDELDDVDWLAGDRPITRALRHILLQ